MNPQTRLQNAFTAANEGRHDEALREYIWFHDHALELEPALYGVRLSFALAYWVELAQNYPAARIALEDIRDRKVQALLSGQGNSETFHDVTSINYYLADERLTAHVFSRLDGADATLAKQCADSALPALIGSKLFQLARRYVTDPFNDMERHSTRLNQDVDDLENEPPTEAPVLDAYIQIYADHIKLLVAMLRGNGEVEEAERLEEAAVDRVKSHSVREAVLAALSSAA